MEKVGVAVWHNGALLTVLKQGSDKYILPGGKPEASDLNDMDTLRRELQEELRCDVVVESLRWIGEFSDESADGDGQITVRLFAGDLDGKPTPSSEIVECRWFDPQNDDPAGLAPSIRNAILPYFAKH